MLQAGDLLLTKTVKSVMPIVNGKVRFDHLSSAEGIDGILLHYDDHNVEHRAVRAFTPKDNRDNYQQGAAQRPTRGSATTFLMNGSLPYTPVLLAGDASSTAEELAAELRQISFDSIDISKTEKADLWKTALLDRYAIENAAAQKAGRPEPKLPEITDLVSKDYRGLLYLRSTFDAQKETLAQDLTKLIQHERTIATSTAAQEAIKEEIRANKESLLLGLAYVNKWFNVDFEGVNLKDLWVIRQDFQGSKRSALDWIIALGKDYAHLNPKKCPGMYLNYLQPFTGRDKLDQALDDARRQFTHTETFHDCFMKTTKAHIIETPSLERPEINVSVAERFRSSNKTMPYLLPLLTVSADKVFINSGTNHIEFGSFERYYGGARTEAEKATSVVENEEEAQRIRSKVPRLLRHVVSPLE